MQYIFLSLIFGIAIGYYGKITINQKLIDRIININLFVLLFLMGFKLGANERLLKSLKFIGFKAIVLCIFSILGSIVLLKGVEEKLYEQNDNDSSRMRDN